MKKYEIIVLPTTKLCYANPQSKFDLIEEDIREPRKKSMPSYVADNKKKVITNKKLNVFWQQQNSRAIESAFKAKIPEMSEVLGTKYYDKVA